MKVDNVLPKLGLSHECDSFLPPKCPVSHFFFFPSLHPSCTTAPSPSSCERQGLVNLSTQGLPGTPTLSMPCTLSQRAPAGLKILKVLLPLAFKSFLLMPPPTLQVQAWFLQRAQLNLASSLGMMGDAGVIWLRVRAGGRAWWASEHHPYAHCSPTQSFAHAQPGSRNSSPELNP